MDNKEKALTWLNKQLQKKRNALKGAEKKPNASKDEISNIDSAINIIEWIIATVEKGDSVL